MFIHWRCAIKFVAIDVMQRGWDIVLWKPLKASVMAEIKCCMSSWHRIQRRRPPQRELLNLNAAMTAMMLNTRTSSTKVGWSRRHTLVCALLIVSSHSEKFKSVTSLWMKLSWVWSEIRTTREATRSSEKLESSALSIGGGQKEWKSQSSRLGPIV